MANSADPDPRCCFVQHLIRVYTGSHEFFDFPLQNHLGPTKNLARFLGTAAFIQTVLLIQFCFSLGKFFSLQKYSLSENYF